MSRGESKWIEAGNHHPGHGNASDRCASAEIHGGLRQTKHVELTHNPAAFRCACARKALALQHNNIHWAPANDVQGISNRFTLNVLKSLALNDNLRGLPQARLGS